MTTTETPTEDMWAGEQLKEQPPRPPAQRRVVHRPRPVQHRGQLRMAEKFIDDHSEKLRHVHGIGWHEWDGARWLMDEKRVDLSAAVETVKNALRELEDLSGDERDDLYKDIRKSESASGLEGMVKIASARPPMSVGSKELDADPFMFNTPTGTVNLLTGDVTDCCREDLITKVAGAGLDGPEDPEQDDTGAAQWEAFLERILPDPEVRAFVQRLFGYSMLGEVKEHVMPIFTGTGANGKSTMASAIAEALGDYTIEVDPALLMESKHERHGAFKMRLRGARLAFCSETEKGRRFSESTMKRLVDGTPIEANLMHKNPIQFQPSHTLIMMTNHLPAVSGDDPAVWRRILVVPFDVVIPVEERDENLSTRLRKAAPAVLGWIYDGWLDYQEQGLNPPEAVRIRTQEYKAASDVLGRFLDERTITTPHAFIKARDLFNAWTAWCHGSGEQPGTEKAFAESMANRGYEKKDRNTGRVYLGMMFAGSDDDDD